MLTRREAWKQDDGYWCVVEIKMASPDSGVQTSVHICNTRMTYSEAQGHVEKWGKGK